MKKVFPKFVKYFYVTTMIAFSTWAGITLTILLIGIVKHPDSHEKEKSMTDDFQKIVSQTNDGVVRHMGEYGFSEPHLKGHFHHIGKWYENDSYNFCINCHGSVPHAKDLEKRSFLNMHSLFISCQVCHVFDEKDGKQILPTSFGWINGTEGSLEPNPDMNTGEPGDYGVKIIQLSGSSVPPQPLFMEKERNYYKEFTKRAGELNETQKGITNKLLHKRCSEKPIQCTGCHSVDKPLIPFNKLGYSLERTKFLQNLEVVDLVQKKDSFFIPTLLKAVSTDSLDADTGQ